MRVSTKNECLRSLETAFGFLYIKKLATFQDRFTHMKTLNLKRNKVLKEKSGSCLSDTGRQEESMLFIWKLFVLKVCAEKHKSGTVL